MTIPYIKNMQEHLVVGMSGLPVRLETTDHTGAALDLAAYTTVVVVAVSPDYTQRLSFTGSFDTGGVGFVTFTPSTGTTFDRPGLWHGQVEFGDTGILVPTPVFDIIVEQKLAAIS